MFIGKCLFLKTILASVLKPYFANEIRPTEERFQLSSHECDYSVSDFDVTSPSLYTCAIQCSLLENCQTFASRGDACGLFSSCAKDCVAVSGGGIGWDRWDVIEGKCF